MTRPISQTGLLRQPNNAKQRAYREGGTKPQRTVLAEFNERQDARILHGDYPLEASMTNRAMRDGWMQDRRWLQLGRASPSAWGGR